MEKTIARWSYWLGITCVIVTIAWKGGNAFRIVARAAAIASRDLILVVLQRQSHIFC
jgi:hypothetical protein